MELPERIRAYVAAMPAAVSGAGGHNATFAVACVLVNGFALSEAEARPYLDEFNARCSPAWSDRELTHKLRSAERAPGDKPRGWLLNQRPTSNVRHPTSNVSPAPVKKVEREEWAKLDVAAVGRFTSGLPEIDTEWFRRRSVVDVAAVTSGAFLDALFAPGERVMIFTRYYSQGDFIWWTGRGGFRLSDERGTAAVPSELAKSAKLGVWFLVQPVSGKWEVGERVKEGAVKYTRRSESNVTRWVHFVLESDELEAGLWMKVVANLRLPICAIYTSGGRSIHALVRYEVGSKASWDHVKGTLQRLVCPLGADPGALSAVRLSRLPGCMREGCEVEFTGADGRKGKKYERYSRPRAQQLVYLNPAPGYEAIFAMREARS